MKVAKSISSEPVLYLMAAVMTVGAGLSMMFTTDHRWLDWHLSRLGEGGQLSAVIFNVGVGLCALLMGVFTHRLVDDVALLRTGKGHSVQLAETVIGVGLGCIAVCMMGIAVFPFDAFPFVHNIFGYGMTLSFVALIIIIPTVLKIFSRRFTVSTYAFVVCMAILFGGYFATSGRALHLIFIEMLVLVYFYAWAIVLTKTIRHNVARLQ